MMKQSASWLAVVVAGVIWSAAPAAAREFQVATATVDITGPAGYPMGGYGARKGVSKGIHDPLLAKVLLIKSGDLQLGLVVCDLVLFTSSRVAQQARDKLGISPVLQISIHTHSGPIPKDLKAIEQDPWFREVEEKVLGALKQAQSRYQPARLSVLEASAYIGHNRRKVDEDGKVTMFWRNAGRVPTAPVDPRVGILRFTDMGGKDLAVVVNYACHAVVLGPDNLDYSADWPGFMYRGVEKQLGGGAVVYFVPGAGGDINPYDDKQPVDQDGFGVARKTGETIATAVLKAIKEQPARAEDFDLQISQQLYEFKDRFQEGGRVPTQATRIMFSKNTGVLAIPAEAF